MPESLFSRLSHLSGFVFKCLTEPYLHWDRSRDPPLFFYYTISSSPAILATLWELPEETKGGAIKGNDGVVTNTFQS